jgi:hypothetical protein
VAAWGPSVARTRAAEEPEVTPFEQLLRPARGS